MNPNKVGILTAVSMISLILGVTVGFYIEDIKDTVGGIGSPFGGTTQEQEEEEYIPLIYPDIDQSEIFELEEFHPNEIYALARVYVFNFTVPYDGALLDYSVVLDNTTYFEEIIQYAESNHSEILQMQIRDELSDPHNYPLVWDLGTHESLIYNTSDVMTSDQCNKQWYTHTLDTPVVLNASKEYFFYIYLGSGVNAPSNWIEGGFVYDTDNGDSQFLWYYDHGDRKFYELNVVDMSFRINITDTWYYE
jgi:hypothetical protein